MVATTAASSTLVGSPGFGNISGLSALLGGNTSLTLIPADQSGSSGGGPLNTPLMTDEQRQQLDSDRASQASRASSRRDQKEGDDSDGDNVEV